MKDGVVITGIGVISPLATTLDELAMRFCAGASAVGPLTGVGDAWGASLADVPVESIPAEKRTRIGRLDRLCRLFLSASYAAVDAARLEITDTEAERVALSFGTGLGCLLTNAEYNLKLVEQGPSGASPRLFAYTVSSAAAGEVSIALGIKGANVTAHAGFAAGLAAVGYGCDLIRLGKADVVLAGGADALGAVVIDGLRAMGLLKPSPDAVVFRDVIPGVYPSEGAAVFVLERADHARDRGARFWGRIDGYASGFEPTLTQTRREATGVRETLQRACAVSGRATADVGFVMTSAHATVLDGIERAALAASFDGDTAPLLFAPKSAWGECFAAHGVLSLALAAALLQRPVPPIAEGLALQLSDGAAVTERGAAACLSGTSLAMIHALCYSGPTVALLLAREE